MSSWKVMLCVIYNYHQKFILFCSRNNYCVKETTNLDQSLCGHTQYFGDQYIHGNCEYRKCSDSCYEGSYSYIFGSKIYIRDVYCCTSDYCNSASSTFSRTSLFFMIFSTTFLILFISFFA